MRVKLKLVLTSFLIFFAFSYLLAGEVSAQSASDIRGQIKERNQQIEEIEQKIKEYETELVGIGTEKRTLQSSINELDISRQKIGADINLTENRIYSTTLEISRLDIEIGDKENRIARNLAAMAEVIRSIHKIESDSLIETVLGHDNLSEVWERVDTLGRFQQAMRDDITELTGLKDDLGDKRSESKGRKNELTGYRNQLSGQKNVLDENRQEKDQLLTVTKNEESNYQNLLAERKAAREQFERELLDLESQLEFILDPSSIPPIGQGLLGWPLDTLTVTQYFGNTEFAQSGAYDGRGHNGVDFRASVGTRVKASLSGTVVGLGNTDSGGCASYGKWILLRHNNGLTTLYAHLSTISVSAGQRVGTSDVIGFSGNTGYSTGPHLHLTTYVSDAVEIRNLGDWYRQNGREPTTLCAKAGISIPIAPLAAYLNPLDYLGNI